MRSENLPSVSEKAATRYWKGRMTKLRMAFRAAMSIEAMRDGRSHGDVGEEVVGEAGGLSKESK